MLNNNIFYHGITRKVIVAFGSLFSNIRIERKKDGETVQTLAIPIAYAPKEKWLVRIEQDPMLENHTYTTLPRLSFEITNLTYDASRKTNRMNYITINDANNNHSKMYAPVPYNIDISLYALTKTQEDGLQIIEQILPYFTPEYTLSLKTIPNSDIVMDVPIILEGVSVQDDYDGDFETRRFVTYTMNFTLKCNFYGPIVDGKIITSSIVDINNLASTLDANIAMVYTTGVPATGTITSTTIENQ
jgi:hypothetical protein